MSCHLATIGFSKVKRQRHATTNISAAVRVWDRSETLYTMESGGMPAFEASNLARRGYVYVFTIPISAQKLL
jgi:hypothetical protein